jgi:two-component system cell cycle response regulator
MPRILTVDDSRAVRMIVTKQVKQLGFDVEEAEDGEQGLAQLEESKFDLVVLDVTMPVLDGPGMLARLRERGDQTPVLMLTSESKRSIVANLMKMGISDYILKPFKPEELHAKICKALKMEGPGAPAAQAGASAAEPAAGVAASDGARPFCDLLVIDDMENVQKRLRQLVPEHLTLAGALNGQTALALARERVFRVVLIDSDMPDVNTQTLSRSLRLLQPNAAFGLLALRTTNNIRSEAQQMGFDTVVFKPFTAEGVDEFVLRYFDNRDLVSKEDNVLRVEAFKGKEDRLPSYFSRITTLCAKTVEDIAAACFAEVVFDATRLPVTPNKTAQLVAEVGQQAKRMGVELRLVGPPELTSALTQYAETKDVPVFSTVAAAQGGA